MRLRLIAAGTRLPRWVKEGYAEYAKRLGPEIRFELQEIPVARRGRPGDLAAAVAAEGRRMRAALGKGDYVVALDLRGRAFSTETLAAWLAERLAGRRDLSLLIGGPDGLDPALVEGADLVWALSALTFPHGLVRLIVAEQLYRAQSLLKHHPYHRA